MYRLSQLGRERKIILVMIAVSLLGGFFFSRYQVVIHRGYITEITRPWRAVVSTIPAFSFYLPPDARHTVDDALNSFSSEGANQNIYTVSVIDYAKQTQVEQDIFETELDNLVSAQPRNQLLATKTNVIAGRRSLEFLIQNLESGWYTKGYIINDNGMVYVLAVLYPHDRFDENAYERFIDSLTLANKAL